MRRGFTLIEILVVMSIIGLLSSVVIKSTQGARDKATITKIAQYANSLNSVLSESKIAEYKFQNAVCNGYILQSITDSSGNNQNVYFNDDAGNGCRNIITTDNPLNDSTLTTNNGNVSLSTPSGTHTTLNFARNSNKSLTVSLWMKVNANTNPYTGSKLFYFYIRNTSWDRYAYIAILPDEGPSGVMGLEFNDYSGSLPMQEQYCYENISFPKDKKWHFYTIQLDEKDQQIKYGIDGKQVAVCSAPGMSVEGITSETEIDYLSLFGTGMMISNLSIYRDRIP